MAKASNAGAGANGSDAGVEICPGVPWPARHSRPDEHLDGDQRIAFMQELHRILVPGGKATIIVPCARSDGAIQDPTHQWPPLTENSFSYFNAESRRSMGVEHYPIRCDFDFEVDLVLAPEWQHRSQAERLGAIRHFWNVASELIVHLVRR